MVCDQREIEYQSDNNRVRNDDIALQTIWHTSEPMELIFTWELHCLWGHFRKQAGREDV